MREIFNGLFGNERLKKSVGEAIANGTSSHAYIFEGPHNSGKETAAVLASAALACRNRKNGDYPLPCRVCPVCNRIFKGISPDVQIVSKEDKTSIGVDKIRVIKSDLYVTPNDSDEKTYIIKDADLMTHQAQNALLISLEEPPPFVTFFLLTENSEALLETVRSRAVTFRMEIFSQNRLAEYLSSLPEYRSKSEEDIMQVAKKANGSLGEAKRIISESQTNDGSLSFKMRNFAFMLALGKTSEALVFAARESSGGSEKAKNILASVCSTISDMIKEKKAPGSLDETAFSNDEKNSVKSLSLVRLVSVFDYVTEATDSLQSNVSPKTVFYDLIFKCRK